MPDLLILTIIFSIAIFLFAVAIGSNLFMIMVDEQVRYLRMIAFYAPLPVQESNRLQTEPVSRYLTWAAGNKPNPAGCARVRFSGRIQLGKNGRWRKTGGSGYFSLAVPAFVWHTTITCAPGIWIETCDYYVHRSAGVNFNLFSFLPLNNAHSSEIARPALFQYLAFTPIFPHVLDSLPAVSWDYIDDTAAIATIHHADISTQALALFDGKSRLESMALHDPLSPARDPPAPGIFSCRYSCYEESGGYQVPRKVVVEQHLPDGTYACVEYSITAIDLTPPAPAEGGEQR
jgi:hypothetical protein